MWKSVVNWKSEVKAGDVFVNKRHEFYVAIKEIETERKMHCLVLTTYDFQVARVVGCVIMDQLDLQNPALFTKREDVKMNIELTGFNS